MLNRLVCSSIERLYVPVRLDQVYQCRRTVIVAEVRAICDQRADGPRLPSDESIDTRHCGKGLY